MVRTQLLVRVVKYSTSCDQKTLQYPHTTMRFALSQTIEAKPELLLLGPPRAVAPPRPITSDPGNGVGHRGEGTGVARGNVRGAVCDCDCKCK